MNDLDLRSAKNQAQKVSMVVSAVGKEANPALIAVGMGGEKIEGRNLYRFADGSMVTANGIVFIGGAA